MNTTFEFLRDFKGPRVLTFRSWRYQLLHWFFGVKPKDPGDAVENYKINKSFYTHYCPLFHFTNLVAIFFLPILIYKGVIRILRGIVSLVNILITKSKVVKGKQDNNHNRKIKNFIKFLKDLSYEHLYDFEKVWKLFSYYEQEPLLTEEEYKVLWEKYKDTIKENRENSKIQAERMRERVIFWTNFSRVFIKGLLNILYIILALFIGWLMLSYTGKILSGLWWFIKLLFSINVVSLVLTSVQIILFITLFCLLGILIWKLMGEQTSLLLQGLIGAVFAIIQSMESFVNSILEFISVFYEQNCPPIKIVSEEEGVILNDEESN